MRTPFFSESEGYQFVFIAVAAVAAVALASFLGGVWAGVTVAVVLAACIVLFYARRGRTGRRLKTAPAHVGGKDERRILVLALATLSDEVPAVIRKEAVTSRVQVLVVCPPVVTPFRRLASDIDGARAQAQQRLEEGLELLRLGGIEVRGEVGDVDPLRAIEDALRTFGADEIVLSTSSDRRDAATADSARERFALPITELQSHAHSGAPA